jgi:hypothetical protein
MDTPTLRILDVLSSSLGYSLSINQLTERIKEAYGTAHYANIYHKLHELKKQGLLSLDLIGRSSNVKLNFQNYFLIDALAEMEMEKKKNFITKHHNLLTLLTEMDRSLYDEHAIKSMSSINPAMNIKLNRIELLFLLRKTPSYHDETAGILKEMLKLQNKHSLRIDSLVLDKKDFFDSMTSEEINPLREALARETTFICPQSFWSEIRTIAEKTEIKSIRTETKPAEISNLDLVYNLNRFGYREFGTNVEPGRKFCIEYITTAILFRHEARRLEAIPIILAKNNFKSNTLAFLALKFGTAGRLMGLLRIMHGIKPASEIDETLDILGTFRVEEIPADEGSILQKMRLYNAT